MPPVFVELSCIFIKININGNLFFAKLNMTGPLGLSSLFQYISDEDIFCKINSNFVI